MDTNKIINADSLEHLKTLGENIFDSCVTDPPYHLTSIAKRFTKGPAAKHGKDGSFNRLSKGFMGQEWDGGDIAFQKEFWEQVYRTIKPGAVLLAFSATRNYHRMAVAIEDAGFEIFDMINWVYGSGFPKRKNLLKPAHEPIVMARKGVNKDLNLDECRIPLDENDNPKNWNSNRDKKEYKNTENIFKLGMKNISSKQNDKGRYPSNFIHDGLDEEWARYFYSAKASKKERDGSDHPTVKPLELMKYLVRLVTPKDGLVLDPFAGTGTTGEAAILENRKYYLIEKTKKYIPVINKRLNKYNSLFV
jgi:site-specific DNA-methyltransferase (adenine-specific)